MLDRRRFLSYIPAATIAVGTGIASVSRTEAVDEYSVGAIETIMRGHGLLLRAMDIYDVLRERIAKQQEIQPSHILKTAAVFHNYLEGFHEQMEERYIFTPMEKAHNNFASIQELKIQHGTGYELTRRITDLAKSGKLGAQLSDYLAAFGRMYRHHTAWEDTVIFPAFDDMEKKRELSELAVTLEIEEKKILGPTGFQSFVNDLADVEKQLGVYDLSTWTAKL